MSVLCGHRGLLITACLSRELIALDNHITSDGYAHYARGEVARSQADGADRNAQQADHLCGLTGFDNRASQVLGRNL